MFENSLLLGISKNMINNKCSWCGVIKLATGIEIHHIDLNHSNNNKDNLIPLCKTCHLKFHSLEKEQKWWEKNKHKSIEELEKEYFYKKYNDIKPKPKSKSIIINEIIENASKSNKLNSEDIKYIISKICI